MTYNRKFKRFLRNLFSQSSKAVTNFSDLEHVKPSEFSMTSSAKPKMMLKLAMRPLWSIWMRISLCP